MNCPKCRNASLKETRPAPDLAVDLCGSCGGAWLDKAEVYRFIQDQKKLYDELVQASKSAYPSDFSCPRCSKMLLHANIEPIGLVVEACPSCGGLWFDAKEMAQLQRAMAASVQTRPAAPAEAPGTAAASKADFQERPLTDTERASIFGADATAALGILVAICGFAAAAAGLVLNLMEKLPISIKDIILFFSGTAAAAGVLMILARAKSKKRRRALLVPGSILSIKNHSSGPWGELELAVAYAFEGLQRRSSKRVCYRMFSELRVGDTLGVVTLPGTDDPVTFVNLPKQDRS